MNSSVTGIAGYVPGAITDVDTITFLKSTDFQSDFVTVTPPTTNWDYAHDAKDAWFKLKPGAIRGRGFRDDGIARGKFELGETTLGGVQVGLFDEDGQNQIATTYTDAGGNYEFTNVPHAEYRVAFTKPAGLRGSPANVADDDIDSDPDPTTGWVTVAVSEGVNPEHVDAGFYPNSPPIAADDKASVNEDGSVAIAVHANDTDPDNDALTIASVGTASFGTATLSGSKIQYAPNPDYHGSDYFNYTISDGQGGASTAWVSVTINPVNDDPTAANDIATAMPNSGSYLMVLGNDSDIDGDMVSLSKIESPPANGTAKIDGSSIVYTPNTGFSGSDTLTYEISDGHGGFAMAIVNITVSGGGGGGGGSGTISGKLFDDANQNGIQDSGEYYIGTSVLVNLLDIDGVVVATTWTSGSMYSFAGIAAGQYRLQFIPPSGYSFSPQDQGGDDNSDSDVDGSGYTGYFWFDGNAALDFDAGIYLD